MQNKHQFASSINFIPEIFAYSETSEMWAPWDQGKIFQIKGCSHLRGLFIMYKIQMGPGNCIHIRRSFHNVKDTNGTGIIV